MLTLLTIRIVVFPSLTILYPSYPNLAIAYLCSTHNTPRYRSLALNLNDVHERRRHDLPRLFDRTSHPFEQCVRLLNRCATGSLIGYRCP